MSNIDLLEKDLCYSIIGYSMNVINEIGHGYREKTYENALCIELEHNNINYSRQSKFPVYYKECIVDKFIPDLIVDNKVIVELKTVENIDDEHRGQLLNYLRVTGIEVGLIINFRHPKLTWEHLVLEKAR